MPSFPSKELLQELGQALRAKGGSKHGAVLFYAEAGQGWAGGSVFVDSGDMIRWLSPVGQITSCVMQLWEEAPADKKWKAVSMFIDGDAFEMEFDYGESWLDDEDEGDRRERLVRSRFGDKPIHYPDFDDKDAWGEVSEP